MLRVPLRSQHKQVGIHIGETNKFFARQPRERVVNSLVTPRLVCCNSLLYGAFDNNFAKFQNTAARMIMRVPKYSDITPVLKELHCLRSGYVSVFKVMQIVHKAVNCG